MPSDEAASIRHAAYCRCGLSPEYVNEEAPDDDIDALLADFEGDLAAHDTVVNHWDEKVSSTLCLAAAIQIPVPPSATHLCPAQRTAPWPWIVDVLVT